MGPGVHGGDLAMFAVLALAGLGSAVVVALALAALVRRRSRSYLLVALALSTLLARTAVAVLSATGRVGPDIHHVLEHALDVTMAGLVIAAVYDARSARKSSGGPASDDSALKPDGGESVGELDRGGAPSESDPTDSRRGENR